jgi:hypothetical protein
MAIGPGRGFILHKIWRVFTPATALWLSGWLSGWLVAALPCSAVEADAAAVVHADTMVVTAGLNAGPTEPATASLVTRVDLSEQSGFGDLPNPSRRGRGPVFSRVSSRANAPWPLRMRDRKRMLPRLFDL